MSDEHALLRAAVQAWNAGRWQAAHDGFEELWRGASRPLQAAGGNRSGGDQPGGHHSGGDHAADHRPDGHEPEAHASGAHAEDAQAEVARVAGDPRPELWRALAQAAAVGVLWRQGRPNGARAVASKAAARLRVLRDEHGHLLAGLDVAATAENLAACVADAARLRPLQLLEPADGNRTRAGDARPRDEHAG